MNFVKQGVYLCPHYAAVGVMLVVCCLTGCGNKVQLPDSQELMEFFNAGPVGPSLDMNGLVKARMDMGPYRVLPDEAIELTMPAILKVVTAEDSVAPEETASYVCRINESGMISLPIVGDIPAAGRTLSQIESAIINAYYPEYTKSRPSVFAKVLEYKTYKVSIVGAVETPGVYALRWDQMSLVNALMHAGGISMDGTGPGAATIRINRITEQSPLAMPVLSRPSTIPSQYLSNTAKKNISFLSYDGRTHSSIDEDLELAFRPIQPGRTQGQLMIGFQGQWVVNQSVDLTNNMQLFNVLDQAIARLPRLPVYELGQRLRSLTDVLYNGSVGRKVEFAQATNDHHSRAVFASAQEDMESLPILLNETPRRDSEIVLPVKGINIPFTDVVLHDGDTISVERFSMPLFTVVGLVTKAGNYEYPPEANYNLIQAIGFAGGLNIDLDPRYATIYRLKKDGTVVKAIFKLKQKNRFTEDLAIPVLPGDIVAVEHTPSTHRNDFFNKFFRLNIGTYFNISDMYD